MEHYKSTLATTAIAVFGLVVAAHTLHPGNYELQPRPARIAASTVVPSTWMDPPARTAGADKPEARVSETARASASDLLAPQMAAVLPPGAVVAPALPSEMIAPADKARKTLAAHRSKVADRGLRRTARLRHAGLARTAAVDPAVAPSEPAPAQASKKIDPIGDLIRGLGLGHDSEG
ncbi:hypothetical protein MKL09_30890 [Methylobacterium sp. J-048]|uniref:hypothetical protein n=1 Tax=Methylobacterium sp. J-048 TaxID=2836635 RepID=UPI001FBBB78D|nr:hypothetical protein [Methylobacterium sp. J-048]MCJ2060916.1 hypothetical protein [Methylobacterium sp. J-048]